MLGPQAAGRLKIVGAYYALSTGRVDFFDRGWCEQAERFFGAPTVPKTFLRLFAL